MQKIYNLEGRNKAIVLFKFFAAIFVVWSHMDIMFPQYKFLATGGAIGDALFFFCSGFTLFLGRDGGFGNWYKRRVSRIFPSVIMWALLSTLAFGWIWTATDIVTTPKYWFITCVLTYYAILYFLRHYLMGHMKAVFYGSFFVICIISLFLLDMNHPGMYGQRNFIKVFYFMFILLGAITALDLKSEPNQQIFRRLKLICVNNRGGGAVQSSHFASFLAP